MNPEFYTDEFRNFKYLKSSPEEVFYYKKARAAADMIQPWHLQHDPEFHWNTRIEFIEQLLDLSNDTIYIVLTGILSGRNTYEAANLFVVENPVLVNGNPIVQKQFYEITQEDLVSDIIHENFYIVEGKYLDNLGNFDINGRVFSIKNLPIIPFANSEFTEIFHGKYEAEKYKIALTDILRHKFNAVSSFTQRL